MRVISEEKLKRLLDSFGHHTEIIDIYSILLDECQELQEPWIPIDENTPKDKLLVLHNKVINKNWIGLSDTHDGNYNMPTHYSELPNSYVIPIHKPELPK